MALKVADRVRENTSTTGTGALTLAGAPDGYREFSSALSENDNTYYTIEENDQYEVGIGTFSSSVLERSVVLKSSNSNNKIELGGSGAVFITYPADKSVYRDQESQVVVDASGLLFSNATVIKDAKITELTDIHSSGTPSSSHIMTFDFTDQNLLIGDGIGGVGSKSVILGDNSGNSTSPNDVVIIGAGAATEGVSIVNSVFVGSQAGPTRSDVLNAPYYSVVMGYNAGDEARHESSIIGYKAGINSYSIGSTALGYFAGSGVGDYATSIGYQAGNNNTDDYTVNIGYQAGYSAGGDDSIWIGRVAGYNSTAAVKSMGLGYAAGQSSSADNSIYLGVAAGTSNTTDNMFFVANNTPASNGSLIKGDLANKRIAIGAADVTLSDTLYVGINSANDVGITVKAATSQSADLTQWQNSAGGSVASITNSGVMTVNGVYASGAGLQLDSITPDVTNNTLYNVAGSLYFNGTAIPVGVSDTATYASGQALSLTYASGLTATNATNISAVTSTANYASGQSLSLTYASGLTATNQTNISTATAVANYASGQVNITTDGTAEASKALILDSAKTFTGVKDGVFNEFDSLVKSSGLIVGNSGIVLSSNTPSVTTNTLYNDGGTLSWNGSAVGGGGGGDVSTAQLNYVSGIAVYSSGQAIENEGLVTYASGQAIENETDLLYVSGAAAYASGNTIVNDALVAYASGQAIENESDLLYVSGAAAYSSGVVTGGIPNFNVIGVNTGSPEYGVDVTGGGASGVIQASGVKLGASGIVFSDGTTQTVAGAPATVTLTAGDGLTGGGTLASDRTFAVNVDDSTIETNSDAIRVKDNGITLAKMAGLARGKIIYGDSNGDPAALTAGGANTVLTSDGTDVSWGSVPVNSYVSGIAAYSSGVVTGGIANFTNVGINTGSPAYGLDVTGGGANGLIQATGVLIGASGIGVGISSPLYPVDVVQHSGVIRASGMHSTISMNADAATITFDLDQATTHGVTLGGTRTLALSNVQIGDKFLIRLQQDGTGSRTVNWFNHIKWAGGSAPTLTTTAHKADIIGFLTASGTGSDYWFDGLVVGQNI